MKSIFLTFFLFISMNTQARLSKPWLLVVSSTYKNITFTGKGYLIQVGDKFYVRTASHVSQGQNLKIRTRSSRGKKLDILPEGRVWNNTIDDDLIPIADPNIPVLATYSAEYNQLILNPDIYLKIYKINFPNGLFLSPKYITNNIRKGFIAIEAGKNSALIPLQNDKDKNKIVFEHKLKPTYEDPDLDYLGKSDTQQLQLNAASNRYIAPVKILSGMSGSPVIDLVGNTMDFPKFFFSYYGKYDLPSFTLPIILSTVTSYARNRATSYFPLLKDLNIGLKNIINQRFGNWGNSEWVHQSGLLFRKFDDGSMEVSPLDAPAGSGSEGDGGSGSEGDGGNGSEGDGSEDKNSREGDMQSPYLKFKIQPGIIFQGKHALLFKINKNNSDTILYANKESRQYILDNQFSESVEFISNLSNGAFYKLVHLKDQAIKHVDNPNCNIIFNSEQNTIAISIPWLGVEFKLNENGILKGKNEFSPFIKTKSKDAGMSNYHSKRKSDYSVDIRGLFSIDLNNIPSEEGLYSNIDNKSAFDQLKKWPYIIIRNISQNRASNIIKCSSPRPFHK